jgi:hypothetical protein
MNGGGKNQKGRNIENGNGKSQKKHEDKQEEGEDDD